MPETPSGRIPTPPLDRHSSPLVYLFVRQGASRRFEELQRKTQHLRVVVMWDRRNTERRRASGDLAANRRTADRRQLPCGTWDLADFTAVTVRR